MAKQVRKPKQSQNVILQEQPSESELEPGDLIAGVILMLVIPAAAYIGLGVVGMPVSGKAPLTYKESLAQKEKLATRKPPLMDEAEYRMRFDRVESLLEQYVPKYRRFSHKEEDPVPKHYFYECASKCLAVAETELKKLQSEIEKSPDLRSHEQQIASRLNSISQLRHDLLKEKVFLER